MLPPGSITAHRPLKLPRPIECDGGLLGAKIPAKIGTVSCEILFPRAVVDGSSEFRFVAPIPDYPWPTDGGELNWAGSFSGDAKKVATWECHAIAIEVSGPEDEIENLSFGLQKALGAWLVLFLQHYDFATKARSSAIRVSRTHFDDIHLFSVDQGKWRIHFDSHVNSFSVAFPSEDDNWAQSREGLEKILLFASDGLQLTIELRLLVDAYRSFETGDLRLAVIDAATASEVYLNQKIKAGLGGQPEEITDAILVSLNGLGGKIRFARKLGIAVPSDSDVSSSGLLTARNKALHGGRVPSISEVEKALKMAEEILEVTSGVRTEPLT